MTNSISRTVPVLPFIALLVLGCEQRPAAVPPTNAQRADSIARVFESQEAYTPATLDSTGVLAFIRTHATARTDSAEIMDFYRRRGFQYAWFVNDSLGSGAAGLLAMVSSTDVADSTQAAEVAHWRAELDTLIDLPGERALNDSVRRATELALTAHFFRMADARYGGFVQRDPRELDWYIPRHKKNYAMLLDSLVAGVNDLSPIEPLHPQYLRLKQALRKYHDLDTLPWPSITFDTKGRHARGARDSAFVALRHRLFLLGDAAVDTGGIALDSTLEQAVRAAQDRFGFRTTGVPDDALMAELNVPPAERIRTILLNMERLRWVPTEQPADLILVNIPEFRMHIYEHDTLAWDMDVVVGAAATRTAVFTGNLSQVVMAPYWNIPQSIISKEILPAVKRNTHYLDRKGMEVVRGSEVVPSTSIDWKKYTTGVPFTIRQKPGPGNALGQVKFLFPNQYSIYFHDTPAKDKFAHEERAFSHGCIRLSEPERLAVYLLREDTVWTRGKVREAMRGTEEVTVRLAHPRPVIIGYFTAWVDAEGRISFRHDIYGHDTRLARELFNKEEAGTADATVPRSE